MKNLDGKEAVAPLSHGVKRVLIFSLTYQPYVGGAELAIQEITDRIDPKEYSFDMVTLRFDSRLPNVERIGNITVYRIGFTADNPKISDRSMPLRCKLSKVLFPFTSFWKARSLQQKNAYDMTWAMMANQSAFGALLFKYAYPHVPYFLELQDGNSLEQVKARQPALRFIWPLYKRIYIKADIIKAISSFIERLARKVGYKKTVVVIPNAVNTKQFSAPISEEKLLKLKSRFDKRTGDVFLFTASRLVLSRGVEDIIRALPHLPGHVKFLIAGSGEDQEKLEKIAKETGVAERVLFSGSVNHDELPAYFKISDIFVRPSIIEGFGSAFVEAFAAGIPVVATPVGGITDFLFDPERNPEKPTGIFCEVRNSQSVARAVKRYLDDPALVARIVANARVLVQQKYDWDIVARDMREKVFKVLAA